MTRRAVIVAEPLARQGLDLLAGAPGVAVVTPQEPGRKALLAVLGDAAALIVRSATRVDAELLAAAPRLEAVVRAGAGLDNVDVPAASARGVAVLNVAGGNTNAATEHTLALLLALARRIVPANEALREGRWERERFLGFELLGRTLGIIGLGRIGSGVAARARAFGMEVIAYDPYLAGEVASRLAVPLVALDELLARADVVSLHVPLADRSRPLLGRAEIERMKPQAVLVNCARGGLVDERALRAALDSGRLAGAALDVFQGEPEPDPELVRHPLVLATPHLGASTAEAQVAVAVEAARKVLAVLAGTGRDAAVNATALASRAGRGPGA